MEMKNAFDRFISTLDLTEETEFLLNTSELQVADSFKYLKYLDKKKKPPTYNSVPNKIILQKGVIETFLTKIERVDLLYGSAVKNPSVMQETQERWVRSLGWEVVLEKKWKPTPIFLSEKFHEQRSLGSYSPEGF